jgi:hypothetical protein
MFRIMTSGTRDIYMLSRQTESGDRVIERNILSQIIPGTCGMAFRASDAVRPVRSRVLRLRVDKPQYAEQGNKAEGPEKKSL